MIPTRPSGWVGVSFVVFVFYYPNSVVIELDETKMKYGERDPLQFGSLQLGHWQVGLHVWGPRVRDTTAGHSTAADLVPYHHTIQSQRVMLSLAWNIHLQVCTHTSSSQIGIGYTIIPFNQTKISIKILQSNRNSSQMKPFIIYVPCQDITITNHVLPHIHGSTTSHNRSILLYNANKSSESQTDYY